MFPQRSVQIAMAPPFLRDELKARVARKSLSSNEFR